MPKETPCHKDTCPFTCTENSEQAQNYGCLPSSIDILDMMVNKGVTWACHSDFSKPCAGALRFLKAVGIEHEVKAPFVTLDDDPRPFLSGANTLQEILTDEQYKTYMENFDKCYI